MTPNPKIRELIVSMGIIPESEHYDIAERVIRQCISIAQDRAAFDWAPPNDVNHIIDEIKEHFGVEE